MDISQLWSTHPVLVVVGIVVAIVAILGLVVVVVCCCLCCRLCCCNNSTPRKSTYRHGHWVTPSDLESGSLNGVELTRKPPKPCTKGGYMLVETDGPEDDPDLPTSTDSVTQERSIARLPHQFHDFIIQKIIPYFNGQRNRSYQFAVVVLLSESDLDNLCQTSFIPSDSGKPILNKNFSAMPQDREDYGNYIVARPFSNSYHSEEEIFGKYSVTDSPFSHLWSAYVERNDEDPKCILIYSWNLPCTRCTEAIIRSLGKEPYNSVCIIVAHTRFWELESVSDRNKNREKLVSKNITVQQVGCPFHIPPAQ